MKKKAVVLTSICIAMWVVGRVLMGAIYPASDPLNFVFVSIAAIVPMALLTDTVMVVVKMLLPGETSRGKVLGKYAFSILAVVAGTIIFAWISAVLTEGDAAAHQAALFPALIITGVVRLIGGGWW